jgi:dGTPase
MPAPYALRAEESRGRRYPEEAHAYRNVFQRDRDRVVHSRAFRRLENKTQVFTGRRSDHFRNRLTHTIEVAQISRTIAAELQLNEDLVEALALVHDVGHPPFGHAGERVLNAAMQEHGDLFDHNLHALRTVEQFEHRYAEFPGLNLTFEVREGIVKHSRDYDVAEFPELAEYLLDERPPLEAPMRLLTQPLISTTAWKRRSSRANKCVRACRCLRGCMRKSSSAIPRRRRSCYLMRRSSACWIGW